MTGRITLMTMAHPWQCDQMGHMNVRFYAAHFDDSSFQLLAHIDGLEPPKRLGWADVRAEFDYRQETPAGTPLTVTSTVTRIGRTSLGYRHAMTHSVTGELLAEAAITSVRFDLDARASIPIEDEARARAEALKAPD